MRATSSRPLVCLWMVAAMNCGGESEPDLTLNLETLSVCQAAGQSVGSQVKVSGEFDGFGYATNSTHVTVATSELCNSNGAGLVFAELANDSEREKLYGHHPRNSRSGAPGDPVVVQGTITRVREGRFTDIDGAVVR